MRSRFQEAVIYGKSVLTDPTTKALYEEKTAPGKSAYNVAVADYFNAPNIKEVDLSNYTGEEGSTIRIKATDDFEVADVQVKIANADGTLVEVGNAVLQSDGLFWLYTATKLNESLQGDKITVTVSDIPGNNTIEEKTL